MGVDYELFWTLNPKTLSPFRKAFVLKQKYDDVVAWNNGNYVRVAIASCFGKNIKYPSSPALTKSKPREMTSKEIMERVKMRAMQINARFGKEGING